MSFPTVRGYTPLDLSAAHNAPVGLLEDPHEVTLGERRLHGLPFAFGTPERAFALAGREDAAPLALPVGRSARWLVFAHAVLETDLYEGGNIGEGVGSYRFVYADGSSVTHELRQRFEIGPTPRKWTGRPIPLDWGQTPFLAANDAEHQLMDRGCGRYDDAGARLVEIEDPQSKVPYVLPYRFYLWSWENPHPERELDRVEARAAGSSIIVGALTASDLAEPPITRGVAEDVIVTLDAGGIDETLEVRVDRGSATYLYRTAPDAADPESRLLPGWGAQRADSHRRGYAKIAASPSAEVVLLRGEAELGRFLWADLTAAGRLELAPGVAVSRVSGDKTWVTGEVRDADTGELLPCRIRFESAEGLPLAPYGHHAHINSDAGTWNLDIGGDVRLGAHTYAFVDGTFEGWLPTGEVTVEMARGFSYRPVRTTVRVDGEHRHVTLTMRREFNARDRGYLSGDTHVHFVSTKGAELEARAEELDVVNLLQTQWGHLFTSVEEFSGRPEHSLDRQTVVFTGQENRTNMLGHINLLGLRTPIMPWCTGGSEEAELGGGLETTLSHWADECRAQGGTVVLAHFPVPYGETAALLATGRLDAVETIAYDSYNFSEYYRYLNAGFQLPIVAGTDKMTGEVPIGMMRTYAGVTDAAEADYWQWSDGIKRGDTMVSSGPLLWLTVAGAAMGGTVRAEAGATVRAEITLQTVFPVAGVEVIVNGEVVDTLRVDPAAAEQRFSVDLAIAEDSWVAVRCLSDVAGRHHDNWERPVFAHTSPVYVTVGAEYSRFDERTLQSMRGIVAGARRYVTERSTLEWAGSVTHRHGEADHLAYLTRPFDEAEAALVATLTQHAQEANAS